jgi:hypothetical protein
MFIFGKKAIQLTKKVEVIEGKLETSFSKVRQDMDSANAWLSYYYQRSQYFENLLNQFIKSSRIMKDRLSRNSSSIKDNSEQIERVAEDTVKVLREVGAVKAAAGSAASREELHRHVNKISDEFRHFNDHLQIKLEELSYVPSKMEALKEQLTEHVSEPHLPSSVEKRLDEMQEKLKSLIIKPSPREKLVQKVTRNSHDYVKAVVLSYIKKYAKISAFQLRDMVVEEQNMTSKSTFYRILEEIEGMEDISTVRQGKEKIYLCKASKLA